MRKFQRWFRLHVLEYQDGPAVYSLILFGKVRASWWNRDYSDKWRERWLGIHWEKY